MKDPAGAISWSSNLTDPIARTTALRESFKVWMMRSPAEAVGHVFAAQGTAPETDFAKYGPVWLARILDNPEISKGYHADLAKLRTLDPEQRRFVMDIVQRDVPEARRVELQALWRIPFSNAD
jgi:hypothetical protein